MSTTSVSRLAYRMYISQTFQPHTRFAYLSVHFTLHLHPMSRDFKSYRTDRLILRPTQVEDAAFIIALFNSPGWLEHIGDRNVHTIPEAEQYIKAKMLKQYQERGFGNYTMITIADGTKVGTCGIYARPGMDEVDIGFAMLPDYMGKGYSYEAASQMMYLAQHEFGLTAITAITTKANIASQNLIKKLGLSYVKNIRIEGDPEVLQQYRLAFDEDHGHHQ